MAAYSYSSVGVPRAYYSCIPTLKKEKRKEKPSGCPDGFPFLMRGEIVMSYQLSVLYYNVQMCSKYVHFLN